MMDRFLWGGGGTCVDWMAGVTALSLKVTPYRYKNYFRRFYLELFIWSSVHLLLLPLHLHHHLSQKHQISSNLHLYIYHPSWET